MIRGRVNARLEALIPLEIRGKDGRFQTVTTVLDTGFSGYLTLPSEVIARLEVESDPQTDVTLAGGVRAKWNAWIGQVFWHERPRFIRILEAGGTPLLGMRLLEGSQVVVQVRDGGDVLIEELDGIEP